MSRNRRIGGKYCLTTRTHMGRTYLEKTGSLNEEGGAAEKEFAQWTPERDRAQGFETMKQAEAMRRKLLEKYAVDAEIALRGECIGMTRQGIPKDTRIRDMGW